MRFIFFCILLTISMPIYATEYSANFIGFNINYNNVFHQSNFKSLPGIPNCCPIFDKGFGSDINYNIFYDYYLNHNWFLKTSLNYFGIYGYFTSAEQEILGNGDQIIQGEFEHRIKINLNLISINPSINYHWQNLSFGLGFGFGFFTNKLFNQEEVITQPSNSGTFLDSLGNDSGSRIRNTHSGELPIKKHILFTTYTNIGYDLPLNSEGTIKLIPNISIEYFLNKISDEMNWRAYSISAGLAVSLALDRPEKSHKKIEDSLNLINPFNALEKNDSLNILTLKKNTIFNSEKIESPDIFISQNKEIDSNINKNQLKKGEIIFEYDTIVVKTKSKIRKTKYRFDTLSYTSSEPMFFKFNVKSIENDAKTVDFDKFKFEQVIVERSLPLLNYIFYLNNEDDFSKNFKILNTSEIDKYDINKLNIKNDIELYDNIFNIIASRMKANPMENLLINSFIGADSDSDNNSDLHLKRAEKIKSYFTNNWGINSERIKLISENIKSTKLSETTGRNIADELRRVELIGSDILLAPYYFTDTVIYSEPDFIRITAENKSNTDIKNYEIKVYIDSSKEEFINLEGNTPLLNSEDLNMTNYNQYFNDSINFIKFHLKVSNKKDKVFDSEIIKRADYNSLAKKKILNQKDYKYMKYNLILFDYNSYSINQTNKQIINQIKKFVNSESQVEITGYTDELGNSNYNNQLSYARARAVADELKIGNIKIKGAGSLSKHINRHTPESRFYARVVEIFITNK